MPRCGLIGSVLIAAAVLAPATGATASSEFPFEYRDGMIWVQIGVRESRAPLNFLLDSGAGLSVINLSTLERIGRLRGQRLPVRGVKTVTTGYWPQRLTVTEDSLPMSHDFLSLDLSALSRTYGKTVDGLVGFDFFRARTVQIDFDSATIRLEPPCKERTHLVSLPLQVAAGAFRVPVSVNHGPAQWFRLDTGCAGALHWVAGTLPAADSQPRLAVALAPLAVPFTRAAVNLGPVSFAAVETGVHKKEIFPGEAGLVGNGLLSRFAWVTIDARAGRLILGQPRQGFSWEPGFSEVSLALPPVENFEAGAAPKQPATRPAPYRSPRR